MQGWSSESHQLPGRGRAWEGPWLCRNQETIGRALPDTGRGYTAMGQTVWREPLTSVEIQVSQAKRLSNPGWHLLPELQGSGQAVWKISNFGGKFNVMCFFLTIKIIRRKSWISLPYCWEVAKKNWKLSKCPTIITNIPWVLANCQAIFWTLYVHYLI